MSYEGYTQCFCRRGHLFVRDAYAEYSDNHADVCCAIHNSAQCGEPIVIKNEVDDTNCDRHGEIPDAILRAMVKCQPKFGSDGAGLSCMTDDAIYEVPDAATVKYLRYFLNGDDCMESIEFPGTIVPAK